MAGNSFGQAFRITTAGESHGPGLVVIIDGCPAGIALTEDDFARDLGRRRPGQSVIVSQRLEPDRVEILSGVFEGHTTGTALSLLVRNQDHKSKDYRHLKDVYRPGHADFGYDAKYGRRDHRGGGRASARETVSRVAAGVIAKKLIASAFDGQVLGYTKQVGAVRAHIPDPVAISPNDVEFYPDGRPNLVRCPDFEAADRMTACIETARKSQDSIGGIAEVVALNVPAGLGEPVFCKLKADLGAALLSLPAVVGFEYGSGFEAATMTGSEHNDLFGLNDEGQVRTQTNHHGGILGGLSSGMPIVLRAALKPTSSIPRVQATLNRDKASTEIKVTGRHDPCLLPRFIPMAEAMVAIVLADHWLRHSGQQL